MHTFVIQHEKTYVIKNVSQDVKIHSSPQTNRKVERTSFHSFSMKFRYSNSERQAFNGFNINEWIKNPSYCPDCYGVKITEQNIKQHGNYCLLTATPWNECRVYLFETLDSALVHLNHRMAAYKTGSIRKYRTFVCLAAFEGIDKCKILLLSNSIDVKVRSTIIAKTL